MGGVIALTVRLPDGKEYRMERWTNILPSIIHAPKFWNGDPAIWKDPLEHWVRESAKKAKGETIISSWQMYKHPFLAPSEYGILVIDYTTMTIVSAQGYESLTNIMPIQSEFQALEKAGLIGDWISIPFPSAKRDLSEKKRGLWPRQINQTKWKIHELSESDFSTAKKLIKELGFVLSDEEEHIWDREIKEADDT